MRARCFRAPCVRAPSPSPAWARTVNAGWCTPFRGRLHLQVRARAQGTVLQPEQSCAPPARPCREKPASLRWVAATDDQGRAYYYNEATHSSQWEKPAVLAWRQVCGLCAALRSCFRAGVVAAGWLGGRARGAGLATNGGLRIGRTPCLLGPMPPCPAPAADGRAGGGEDGALKGAPWNGHDTVPRAGLPLQFGFFKARHTNSFELFP